MYFFINLDENLPKKNLLFKTILSFLIKKNMGSFGHKFVIFDQELQTHGAFGCQRIIFNNFKGPLGEEWAEKWVLRGICTPITKKWYVCVLSQNYQHHI